MNTWPCGTQKSAGNAFSGATLSEREPVKRSGVPPKPKKIHLRGSMVYDSTGKKTVPLAPNTTGMSVSRATPSAFRDEKLAMPEAAGEPYFMAAGRIDGALGR